MRSVVSALAAQLLMLARLAMRALTLAAVTVSVLRQLWRCEATEVNSEVRGRPGSGPRPHCTSPSTNSEGHAVLSKEAWSGQDTCQ